MLTIFRPALTGKFMENKENKIDSFLSKTWQTKATRFTADQRLRDKHRWSTISLAMTSLYLITISSADILGISLFPSSSEKYVFVAILFLSIFVLIITLIESSRNFLVEAEKMHQCALEIQSVYHRLDLAINSEIDTYELRQELTTEYDSILLKYPNHEQRAYQIFKATKYKDFPILDNIIFDFVLSKILLVWYWILDFWKYCLIILGPPVVVILLHIHHPPA